MFFAETSIQLVPDATLLIHLFLVIVMVVVLNRTLLRPINKILEDRDKNILGKTEQAKDLLKTQEATLADYNKTLFDARSEGYQLLEKERATALKEKEDKVKAFREENYRKVGDQLKTAQDQELKVRNELEAQAETLGAMITEHILQRR